MLLEGETNTLFKTKFIMFPDFVDACILIHCKLVPLNSYLYPHAPLNTDLFSFYT